MRKEQLGRNSFLLKLIEEIWKSKYGILLWQMAEPELLGTKEHGLIQLWRSLRDISYQCNSLSH